MKRTIIIYALSSGLYKQASLANILKSSTNCSTLLSAEEMEKLIGTLKYLVFLLGTHPWLAEVVGIQDYRFK